MNSWMLRTESKKSEFPNVDIRHSSNLTQSRFKKKPVQEYKIVSGLDGSRRDTWLRKRQGYYWVDYSGRTIKELVVLTSFEQ